MGVGVPHPDRPVSFVGLSANWPPAGIYRPMLDIRLVLVRGEIYGALGRGPLK
jgi:hypothetical protein